MASSAFRLLRKFTSQKSKVPVFQEPIRSEIFGASRLESHADSLARAQPVQAHASAGNNLAGRVADNKKVLEESYLRILKAVKDRRSITPAAEWLIDNFHIVRAQLRDIHDHLPPKYYRQLPKLADGPLKNFPRVYGIAWAFVAHTDSRIEPDLLVRFLKSYQNVQPLTIGELWAVSITLRVVLMENLRRISERIAHSQEAREEADSIANEILGLTDSPPRPIEVVISLLEGELLSRAFIVQLLQRLRFQGSRFDPLLEWLEERLARDGLVPDELVGTEHSSQTSANATVRNIITSARMMAAFDWQGFFEEVSLVEKTLRKRSSYGDMDFATRNRYRHALEEVARFSEMSELSLAKTVVARCEEARLAVDRGEPMDERATDPGYYLISSGRFLIEPESGFRAPFSLILRRWYMRNNTPIYLGSFLFFTFLIWAPLVLASSGSGAHWLALLAIALSGLFPASQFGLALVNRLTIALLGPRHLPRLRLEGGIPKHLRTFVVVPTLFLDEARIEEQLEQLEIYYLANPKGDLYFALLSDWRDADHESVDGDEVNLEIARKRLSRLNEKYGRNSEGLERFYVFHRRRLFNPSEGKWIGWERKRGKLHEFNRLLRGHRDHSFLDINGLPATTPPEVRYVITLDSDTRLPNGSVMQLVGSLAHPLNRPHFDEKIGRVTSGYGILQPRVTPTLPTMKEGTIFQRLSTGNSGIDPYASAISDVYQDLFGEGSFTGKGIYDVDVFEQALASRTPENSLLSHDLFEGNFARCGFVSDVELFEDFPWHSGVAAARSHRWIRGDWQLLPWILGRAGNSISVIGRWKMVDNLRRSLVAPFTFLTIILSLACPYPSWSFWVIASVLSLACDSFISAFADLMPDRRDISLAQHFSAFARDFYFALERTTLFFVLLPFHTWVNSDAVVRALFRTLISRRHMLEWTTAAQVGRSAGLRLLDFLRDMRGAAFLSAGAMAGLAVARTPEWKVGIPFVTLWLFSPWLAQTISSPTPRKLVRPLEPDDLQLLNRAARRTWLFFATFVTEQDHYLPPDNFQEDPVPIVAHRSSPTNFGLYLLSTLAARDFGWIGIQETAERLHRTLASMRDLPRHQGHFYNWYETTDRRALDPKYISSVDNGNLAGHLLAVAQGCQEFQLQFTPSLGVNQGVLTTFLLLKDAAIFLRKPAHSLREEEAVLLSALEECDQALHSLLPSFSYWKNLGQISQRIFAAAENCFLADQTSDHRKLRDWAEAMHADIHSHLRDLTGLVPWAAFTHEALPPHLEADLNGLWEKFHTRLRNPVPLKDAVEHAEILLEDVAELRRLPLLQQSPILSYLESLSSAAELALRNARELIGQLQEINNLCHQLFREMDFGLLYDPVRKLFSIGFRVGEKELDASFYDLMASEARLTSFVAIAKGDVPVNHWFHLGRALTKVNRGAALLSWSGSMFEYLMPSLVMHTPEGSLMDQTMRLVVRRQVQYGIERGVPWGVSESAYNKRDVHLTYQYTNFGVPDLGLKRGLGLDLVVAPYATLLAAMVDPAGAGENLRRIAKRDGLGHFGYYEAIDYTPTRLPEGA